jgi:CBS domain containing-hemolysin-like protein
LGSRSKSNSKKSNTKWLFKIICLSIVICGSISLLSDVLLKKVNILVAFIILIFIIFTGIVFDIIGVAVTAASETPFHAMASKKIKGAKTAIKLIKNADKTSSICNDVVGDVCGIVSGSMGILIVNKIHLLFSLNESVVSIIIGVMIGAFTIGGKSLGKNIAINRSNEILFKVCKIIYFFKKDR